MSKQSETKQQINEILQEYFSEDVGGGWSILVKPIKKGGKTYFDLNIKFEIRLEEVKGRKEIDVYFPVHIADGAPRDHWETELRELLDRVSREFTGDVEQTIINLKQILDETSEPHASRRTMEEFYEQIDEMDLWRFRKYATAVSWDEWEMMMMREEQERKNKKNNH